MKEYMAIFIVSAIGFESREKYFFQCKEERYLKERIELKHDELEKQWKRRFDHELQNKSLIVKLFKLYEMIEITHKVF